MRRISMLTLLLLICCMAIAQSGSEKPYLKFKNISGNLGLPGEYARCIIQDKLGFIWFGTDIGFKYFDGYTYKEYFLNTDDIITTAMTEDQNGDIWAFAGADGVYKLERKKDILTRYHVGQDTFVALGQIYPLLYKSHCLFHDKNGALWVGTHKGFYRFDGENQKFILSNQPNINYTSWVFKDKRADYWEVLTNGIRLFNSKDSTIIPFQDAHGKPKPINGQISHVLEDKAGIIWITVLEEGLYRFDKVTKILTNFRNEPNNPNSLSFDYVLHAMEDSKGRFWIANDDGGLDLLNRTTNRFYHYQANFRDVDIPNAKPLFLFEDNAQGLWVSHYHGGIHYVANNTKPFKNYAAYAGDSKGLSNPYISAFFESVDGSIWVSTDGGGLNLWDRKQGVFKHFRHNPNKINSLNTDKVGTVIEDKKGYIWLNTFLGLEQIDIKSNKVKHFTYSGLYLSRTGEMWFAQEKGLHKFDYNKQTFVLTIPDIYYLFEDSKGNDWVAKESGIYRYDFNTQKMTDCISVKFMTLKENSKGNFWISLFPQGDTLLQYDPVNKRFLDTLILKNAQDHLFNRMTIDNNDNVWLGTKNGLYRYDPLSKVLKHYDYNDGLASNFYRFANPIKTRNGELLFGSNKGFTIFHPDSLKDNTLMPPVHITTISLDNKELPVAGSVEDTFPQKSPLKQHILFTDKITLNHLQNNLSFGFTALNYETPQKNQYKYKLEGYDKDWINTPASARVAKYTNLSPGSYTFRVIASNNDGVWNEQGDTLEILILPPWWRTWWAYLFYVVLIGGSIFTVYRFQLNRRLEQAEAVRLKEMDAVKTKLYTNITHEFRTPLTVILGMAQQVLDKPKDYFQEGLKMIIRNGQNLLNLVNQMLDLSKLESGKLSLHYQQGDVVNFLKYIVESFHSLAENKGLKIHFLTDEEQLTIDFDEMRLQQVLFNLLSNAIKFTPTGGNIYLSVRTQEPIVSTQNRLLVLKIKDTGIGITEGSLPFIFDRFYQVDDSHTRHGEGTGIGLALTRELVKLMEGDITVESYPNKGTEFKVTLPIRQLSDISEGMPMAQTVQYEIDNAVSTDENPFAIAHENAEGEKPLVLIADDNADVRAYLMACLATDYRLIIAKDGNECENIAFENIPDLIILDVMMPFKDGFEVCKTLKTDERTSHISIIMLTAKADMDSKLQGLERGADAYLMKPFHKEELLLRIKKLLELRQQLQKHYLLTISDIEFLKSDIQNPKNVIARNEATEGVSNPTDEAALESKSPQVGGLEHAFVIKVKKTIDAHLNDYDFDVEKLSRALTLSPSQVHRKLLALTGLTTINFIRYVRLAKAKEFLLNSGYSINAIAYDSGFNDPAYFIRVFKQEFGVTPQVWREQNAV